MSAEHTPDVGAPRSRRLWLAYLIGAFGLSMVLQVNFLVPLRARELGAGFDLIGLIVGASALSAAFMAITSGSVIDRFGPKWSFVLGTAGTAILTAACTLVADERWFLVVLPLQGVAWHLGWVASQAYITAIASDEERPRLTGRFSFFTNVGQMAGPLLVGAGASLFGFRWGLLVPALYALSFALLGLGLTETRDPDHAAARVRQGAGLRAAVGLLPIRGIQVALLLSFTRLWTSQVFSAFFPVLMVESDIDPGLAGTVMASAGLVAAAMAPTTGFWTRWASAQTVTLLGLACNAAAILLAPHMTTVPLVFLVPVLVGIGSGLSLPLLISIVTSAAPPLQRGVALGLRGMVNQTAATAGPAVVGALMTALGLTLGFTFGGATAGVLLVGARVLDTSASRRAARTGPD